MNGSELNVVCNDKNFGIFDRFFVEKSVFGEPGKEKCKEISTAEKVALKLGKSAIFQWIYRA